jgi:hypothetical protein
VKVAEIWPFVLDSSQIDWSMVAGIRRHSALSSDSGKPVPDFDTSRIPICFAGIWLSDTKIQGPLAVDSSYPTNKFQCSAVADSDKRAWKNEEFKSRK